MSNDAIKKALEDLVNKVAPDEDGLSQYEGLDDQDVAEDEAVEETAQQIRQYIETEIIETQISDREVLLGMFEANQDNLTIPEILGVIRGQISSLEQEQAKLREPME